jgi:DNA primase
MFTIHNVSGKVVAFAGRTLSSDKKQPKYINSPESEIYNKRAVLYGLYFAKEAIRKEDECILVEGYTDVITLHQGNVQNVVASSGTSLTKEQIRLVKRYTQNIKIIYDGDPAGIKAALRGLDLVLESDMNVKLVLLPDGQDPDSFLAQQGTEGFVTYLKEHEEDFVFFKTRVLLDETGNDPIRKTAVIRDIVASIAKIPDTFKRALYVRQCSTMLDLSENILNNEVNKVIKADIKNRKLSESNPTHESQPYDENDWLKQKPIKTTDDTSLVTNDAWQERAICSILINYGHKLYDETPDITVARHILESVQDILTYFDIPLYRKIIEIVSVQLSEGPPPEHTWYVGHEDEEIRKFAIDALSTPYIYASWENKEMFLQTQKMPDENYTRDTANALLRLQLRKSRRVIKELQDYFDHATPEEKETDEYLLNLKVMQVLLQQRNQMANDLGTVTL